MVLAKVPTELGLATTLMVATPRLTTEPRLKGAPLLEELNVPWLDNADTKENVGGSVLVKNTPVAVSGPAFVREMAKVTLLPALTGFGEANCETDRSVGILTTIVALLVLLALLGSGCVAAALVVLVKVPIELDLATT